MKIIRSGGKSNFTTIPNDTIRDANLSFRARGVLSYILSHTDGWHITAELLATYGKEGRDAIRKALNELKDNEYLVYAKVQDKETGRWITESTVYDIPLSKLIDLKEEKDPLLTKASFIVKDAWETFSYGQSAQPPIAVIRVVANALKNGLSENQLSVGLTKLAIQKKTVTVSRLNHAIFGKDEIKGQLKADSKTNWALEDGVL